MARIYLFPGQGSQRPGMGAGLFERFPWEVAQADEILGYRVAELCLGDDGTRLNQTRYTQPALFVVNALHFLARLVDTGQRPAVVAGHSLGEYSALYAAGVVDFATGLRLVRERAELMAAAPEGGMAAVIGLPAERLAAALRAAGLDGLDLANQNSPLQTVIAGPLAELARSEAVLTAAGATLWRRLPVSAAFHSRAMTPAAQAFRAVLARATFAAPRLPVLSNVTARPHEAGECAELLARQIAEPVRWTECVRWLLAQPEPEFSELGPGNVLTGLVRRVRQEVAP